MGVRLYLKHDLMLAPNILIIPLGKWGAANTPGGNVKHLTCHVDSRHFITLRRMCVCIYAFIEWKRFGLCDAVHIVYM